MSDNNIGNKIKELRLQKDMTLKELAKRINVQEATVQRYESGAIKNIPYDRLIQISAALGCTPQEIMGWNNVDYVVDAPKYSPHSYILIEATRGLSNAQMIRLYDFIQGLNPNLPNKVIEMMHNATKNGDR